jgi:exodeoxyribonuclease VII small subunit
MADDMNNTPDFETALKRLEDLVKELEKPDLPLEKSMELFQEGTKLVALCRGILDQAEQEVKVLLETSDGRMKEEDLDQDD